MTTLNILGTLKLSPKTDEADARWHANVSVTNVTDDLRGDMKFVNTEGIGFTPESALADAVREARKELE